jgi:APA family basic amino acid/polyamine antiporter
MSLYREIGLASAVFLVIGNIIGIGIFTTSGLISQQLASSSWLILIWLLGGFLALVGAICYSHLGIQFPKAGGEYAFLRPTYGPLAAFLSGWASLFIGFSAPIAASAVGLAHYLVPYLPAGWISTPLVLKIIAISALLLVTLLLSLGLKAGNRVHSVVTVLNFLLVLVFAVLVLNRAPVKENLLPVLQGGWSDVSLASLASAVILVMFTYSGWNAAAYIAEEIRTPQRNIPLALVLGTVFVILLYILVNLAYFAAVPSAELSGEIAVADIAARRVFGSLGGNLVNLLILCSILSSLTAMSIAGPRVYYAMSRDRLFPGWLSTVHPEKKIPLKAIWFQTALATAFVTLGTFRQIVLYSGFVLIFFSTLTVSALFKTSKLRLLPSIFVAVNALVLIYATVSNPKEALAGLATVAIGIPVYFYYQSRASRDSGPP